MENAPQRRDWVGRVLVLALFAVAFAYVEAAVVVYLRIVYDPIRASINPGNPGHPGAPADSLLPLITLEQLRAADPQHVYRLGLELGRELATLIMLAAVATLARRRRGEWLAMFLIAFGVWDIAYYASLKAMIGFPASWLTWDILFLLPVPWLGPVLAPVIVSVTMIGAGLVVLAETARGRPLRPGLWHWGAVASGALLIIASFCKDYAQTTAGEMPESFHWLLFGAGEALAVVAFLHALSRSTTDPAASRA